MENLTIKDLFKLISDDLNIPPSSLDKFVDKLEGEFIFKAEQLSSLSTEKLQKELGLPLGIALKIEEILEKETQQVIVSPRAGRRRQRGASVILTNQVAISSTQLRFFLFLLNNSNQNYKD